MNEYNMEHKVLTRSFAKSLFPIINSYMSDEYYLSGLSDNEIRYFNELRKILNNLVKNNQHPNNYYFFCSKCLKFVISFAIHKKNEFLYKQIQLLTEHFKQSETA